MLDYIILGTVQGFFEWLPISSQGITALASQALIKEIRPLEAALFLHLGTLFAVLIYFRKEWFKVFKLEDKNLVQFLIISTLVSGVVGFFLYNAIKDMAVGNALLVITGFGLLFTAFFHKKKRKAEIGFNKLAFLAGFLQGLAIIPGLSRSGATIFGLSLGKLKPEEILKISYMMSAPVILAMSAFLFLENPALIQKSWPALIFSFLIGFLTLDFLLKTSAKINFFKFSLIFAFLCFLGAGLGLLI